ncbi:MAG: hypothetical protein QXX17_01560 [Conexivisphaerales archaeon]
MSQKYDYDVIIAGGGMSGLLTAAAIGHYSKQNARVLVIDRNKEDEPGKKTNNGWTCGDATSKGSLEYLRKNIGISYSYPELEHPVKGVVVFSPDHQTKVLFEGEGYILNRKLLPRRQVNDAKKLGVDFIFGVSVEGLIAEDGWIRGIVGRTIEDGSVIKKTARVVIDSAGSATKLRQHLPINCKIEKEIDKDDLESTGRYIYEFDLAEEDKTWFDPDYAIIHLDQYLAPGGYCLAPDTPVICRHNLKPIQKVEVGDEVLTSMGWMPVADTNVRDYSGYLVAVTPYMLNHQIKLTPEHLVRVWNPREGEHWKRADELNMKSFDGSEDYLIVPLPQPIEPIYNLDISSYLQADENSIDHNLMESRIFSVPTRVAVVSGSSLSTSEIKYTPDKIGLTEEFLELCGWYVSNGYIDDKDIVISRLDYASERRISNLVNSLNLQKCVRTDGAAKKNVHSYSIRINSKFLSKIIGLMFGARLNAKKIPAWVHDLALNAKFAFLRGVCNYHEDGQGNKVYAERLAEYGSSYGFAIDLWLLLASIGVISSIQRKSEKGGFVVILSNQSISSKPDTDDGSDAICKMVDGRVYLKIKKIERIWYSGPVYDLNSAGDFTALFNVHNCWTFPKGKTKVNIGLGVQKSALDMRNKVYGKNDNLQSLIDQYVAANKSIRNPRQPTSENDKGNTKGNWQVPVRRHNDCMVANGYAIVGDAAWMPRPIDAGGIGPSIYSSVILGKVVAQALEANDTSEAGLWSYNIEYMKTYGYQMASFQVLRAYLQTLTNTQIDYGMKYFLSEDDVAHITRRQHPEFNRIRFLNPVMWVRILKEQRLASGLRYTAKKSQELIEHNLNFPEKPDGWFEWKKTLVRHINEAYRRLGINKVVS